MGRLILDGGELAIRCEVLRSIGREHPVEEIEMRGDRIGDRVMARGRQHRASTTLARG